jgi:hypothetical protein
MTNYVVHIGGQEAKYFTALIDARVYVERQLGTFAGQFDIIQNGIVIRGTEVQFYVGDKEGKPVRMLNEKELRMLEDNFVHLQNIGSTKITPYDVYTRLLDEANRMRTLMKKNPGKYPYDEVITYMFILLMESHGISLGTKQYRRGMTALKYMIRKIKNHLDF